MTRQKWCIVQLYTAQLVIRHDEDKKLYLYDIVAIKKIGESLLTTQSSYIKNLKGSQANSPIENTVPQISDEYKPKFSLPPTDSKGSELSEGQRFYFKDAQTLDKEGNLLRLYHGTDKDFTVFDRKFIGGTGRFEGAGFNFTPFEGRAMSYDKVE